MLVVVSAVMLAVVQLPPYNYRQTRLVGFTSFVKFHSNFPHLAFVSVLYSTYPPGQGHTMTKSAAITMAKCGKFE